MTDSKLYHHGVLGMKLVHPMTLNKVKSLTQRRRLRVSSVSHRLKISHRISEAPLEASTVENASTVLRVDGIMTRLLPGECEPRPAVPARPG